MQLFETSVPQANCLLHTFISCWIKIGVELDDSCRSLQTQYILLLHMHLQVICLNYRRTFHQFRNVIGDYHSTQVKISCGRISPTNISPQVFTFNLRYNLSSKTEI